MNNIEDEINQKVHVDREPALVDIINHVRTINATIATKGSVTTYEKHTIVSDLNAEWRSAFGQEPVFVSGAVSVLDDDGKLHPVNLDGAKLLPDTFDVIGERANQSGATYARPRTVFKTVMRFTADRLTERDLPNGVPVPRRGALVQTDLRDVLIHFDQPSSLRASAWLGANHKAVKEDVRARTRMIDQISPNILEPLHGIELPGVFTSTVDDFARQCLRRFLNDRVQFDSKVPYLLSTDGPVGIVDAQREITYHHEKGLRGLLVTPEEIEVARNDAGDMFRGGLALSASALYEDMNRADIPLLVPIDSITALRSMRHEHFRPRP